jgi:hypothetical protein
VVVTKRSKATGVAIVPIVCIVVASNFV